MSPAQALKVYEKKVHIARVCKVDKQVVQGWFKSGSIPIEHQMTMEVDTAGRLRASVAPAFRKLIAGEKAAA